MRSKILAATLLALAAIGCAPLPGPTPIVTPGSRVARGTAVPVDTTYRAPVPVAVAQPKMTPAPARVDSGPSSDAIEVLRSIPDPLTGATGTATDTQPESTGSDVPIPSPTQPLGERPGQAQPTAPDTAAAAAGQGVPPAATPGSGGPPPAATPGSGAPPPAVTPGSAAPARAVPPDSCWRLQIAAPLEQAEADQMKSAGESVLLVPMAITDVADRHKVRTRDCFDRAGAERLRQRAEESGFSGAFLVRGDSP